VIHPKEGSIVRNAVHFAVSSGLWLVPRMVRRSPGLFSPSLLAAAATLLVSGVFPCATLEAQGIDPSYRLHLTPQVEGGSGAIRSVECFIDIDPSGSSLAAWSLGICHDAALVTPIAVVAGAPLATMKNGAPVDFLILEFEPNLGFIHGVIVCFTSCAALAAPADAVHLFTIDYALIGEPGNSTQIAFCDTVAISGNPVSTIVVTAAAGSRVPLQDPAAVTILETHFRRGDCGNDGGVGIADAIFQLSVLFGPSVLISCDDACDSNDDGLLNIADPVRTLGYLFGGGAPLAAPFPGCGGDPSADALECGAPTDGC
jgi:hypothetical protein